MDSGSGWMEMLVEGRIGYFGGGEARACIHPVTHPSACLKMPWIAQKQERSSLPIPRHFVRNGREEQRQGDGPPALFLPPYTSCVRVISDMPRKSHAHHNNEPRTYVPAPSPSSRPAAAAALPSSTARPPPPLAPCPLCFYTTTTVLRIVVAAAAVLVSGQSRRGGGGGGGCLHFLPHCCCGCCSP